MNSGFSPKYPLCPIYYDLQILQFPPLSVTILMPIISAQQLIIKSTTIMKKEGKRPQQLDALKAIGYSYPKSSYTLDQRDAIIYALSIGFSEDPLNEKQLKYTYEDHPQFSIFPTFCSMVTKSISIGVVFSCPHMPIPANPLSLLAEQRVEFYHSNLEHGKTYETSNELCDIIDKGKFVLMGYKMETHEKQSGRLAFVSYSRTALPGVKGDGYKGSGSIPSLPKRPTNPPIYKITGKIALNQPLLYRLNGYKNGIHADPKVAQKNNFKRPIMHGIGTLEFCVKQIIQQLWEGDAKSLKEYHGRFLVAVYPGQSLELNVWVEDRRYIFEAEIVERKKVAVFGYVEKKFLEKL